MPPHRPRVLIFIVAYNAERTIESVLARIPASLSEAYHVEVLIIDDASSDATFARSSAAGQGALPFPVHVLFNPVNQGYGGNQMIGYHYAMEAGFDFVVLLHGDGQYAPECLATILAPLKADEADAVFGSRMIEPGAARRGGMPLYKFVGNKILTGVQNSLLRSNLSEFHSGYRAYSIRALASLPFDKNSKAFHFDTEIIVQLMIGGWRIQEVPIPTYYGDEICHVNGMRYAWDVLKTVVQARFQEMNLFFDPKFDCARAADQSRHYGLKLNYPSSHTLAFDAVKRDGRVLDLGCGAGYFGALLRRDKHCTVTGVDDVNEPEGALDRFVRHNLDQGPPPIPFENYDTVLLLDVIEHLSSPERFVADLRDRLALATSTDVVATTGNVAFFVTRAMLALGHFNYGKRGILDLTHTRLFTFSSFRRLFTQAGYEVIEARGVPAPFPLAIGDHWASRFLLALNSILIRLHRGLFSYQIYLRVKPLPALPFLLREARLASQERKSKLIAQATAAGADHNLAAGRR